MKKILIFFIILLLPSVIAIFAMSRYLPQDFKFLTDMLKEKIVTIYPWLNRYLHVINKVPIKEKELPPVKEKPIVPNLHHFTNAEVYGPICGKDIKEKFSNLFMGCDFCPKYLNSEVHDKNFEYFSETRGKFFKKDEEEAAIFMKGCSNNDRNGMAITIRKGYGGWQRQSVLQGVVFDQAPLEYQDSNGFFIFISRRTTVNNDFVRQELIRVQIKEKELSQRVLFSVDMVRGEKCDKVLQASFEYPVKKNDRMFQTNLEIIGCRETKLTGAYKVTFNLKDDDFIPSKETSLLMTKIEKYGESK
jgi:hypothetical protein